MPPSSSHMRNRKEATMEVIHDHVYKNDVDSVRSCIEANPSFMNEKDEKGQTPLIIASLFNRFDILDVLLQSHCDINTTNVDGNTALHEAVDKGNTEIVRRLLSSNWCNTNIKNKRGETPLMKAAFYDYAEIARLLLKEGATNPDVLDDNGQTALLVGLREGSDVTVDTLLKHGCNVSIIDNLGHSALYIAVHSHCNKTLDLAKKLLAADYDIHIDKMWLMNEEKHNVFYQDDDFYAQLRRNLRHISNEQLPTKASTPSLNERSVGDTKRFVETNPNAVQRSQSSRSSPRTSSTLKSPISSPFAVSPSLRQKMLSSDSEKFCFSPLKFTKQSALDSAVSELNKQKSPSFRNRRHASMPSMPSKRYAPCFKGSSVSSEASEVVNSSVESSYPAAHTCEIVSLSEKTSVRPKVSEKEVTSSASTDSKIRTISNCSTKAISTVSNTHVPHKTVTQLPGNSTITYRRQISMELSDTAEVSKSDPTRKVSLPTKPSVHFSTKIKVIDIGRKH